MPLFSKKLPHEQENLVNNTMFIKTMQDDLNTINGVTYQKEKMSGSQITENEIQKNTLKKIPEAVFTNQSPFALQEQTQETQQAFTKKNQAPETTKESSQNIHINSIYTSKTIIFLSIFTTLVSAGGVYYFITTRAVPADENPSQEIVSVESTTPPTQAITPQEKPVLFSVETPNYLPIDTKNATPQSIQALLSQTAQQVTTLNSQKPIEFFITNTDNTPLSFTSFAHLSGITLSQVLLGTLGEKFSLFIYANNNQTSNIGLAIELKNESALQKTLKQEESLLVRELTPLFLNDAPTKLTEVFSNGIYRTISLRYVNIHPETGLSIDYAIVSQRLVISTSMKTHHALLDSIQK